MKLLDVLDPHLNLNQRFFVEASAGCGKTFAIENVFLRLLMQKEPSYSLEDLLVLTFTKEATKDLKKRIKSSIQAAIVELSDPQKVQRAFIQPFFEVNSADREATLNKLKSTLLDFDQAQIFTLHGFCYRMLMRFFFESKLSLLKDAQKEELSLDPLEGVLQDFLLHQINPSILSTSQLELLLQSFRGDFDTFFHALLMELAKEKTIWKTQTFQSEVEVLRKDFEFVLWFRDKKEEFLALSEHLKGVKNKSKDFKKEFLQALDAFIDLASFKPLEQSLDAFIPHASFFFSLFDRKNFKVKAQDSLEKWALFLEKLNQVQKSLASFYDPDYLFLNLVSQIYPFYHHFLEKHQLLTPNQILSRFHSLLQNSQACQSIAHLYPAVIVDEFQDTDEMQWAILNEIFLMHHPKTHPFFLVGDPKQSIYAFRDADVYTYLRAAKALGADAQFTLHTNYRSQPNLIEALNELFGHQNAKWMDLPKNQSYLPYRPVKSRPCATKRDLKEDKAAIHWIIYEEESKTRQVPSKKYEEQFLFPFIAREVIELVQNKGMHFSDFAILVRDRFQNRRLKAFLSKCAIPYQSTRPELLTQEPSLFFFCDLLEASLLWRDRRVLRRLFLNPFFGAFGPWTKAFELTLAQKLAQLYQVLEKKNFMVFFDHIMNMRFEELTFGQGLLRHEGGLEVYHDWQQLCEYASILKQKGSSLSEILFELKKMAKGNTFLKEGPYKPSSTEEDAVHLLTLHLSKGLEFEVVFPIGLINETPQKQRTVPLFAKSHKPLVAKSFCHENAELFEKESQAEKLRQLYVATTRAKERLYLPVVFSSEKKESEQSAMSLFLKRVSLDSKEKLMNLQKKAKFSVELLNQPIPLSRYSSASDVKLIEPKKVVFQLSSAHCHSFSSLSQGAKVKVSDLDPPLDFKAQELSIHSLPAGPQTGVLYHKLLENLDFQSEKINIHASLKHTVYERWESVISSHLLHLLDYPLLTLEGEVCLRQLDPTLILREVPFLYPHLQATWDKRVKRGDFLTGVIDLVFLHRNYVYFLDYKTNWLGPDTSYYSNPQLAFEMHEYDLQAKIYAGALQKYLKLFEKEHCQVQFGGAFYWFIRGVDEKKSPGCCHLSHPIV